MFRKILLFLVCSLICVSAQANAANSVFVKYRGQIDLTPFECFKLKPSSLVQALCYDEKETYLLVDLNGTFYHYCEIPSSVVQAWLNSSSLGKFYSTQIKGNYDCRLNYMPSYD